MTRVVAAVAVVAGVAETAVLVAKVQRMKDQVMKAQGKMQKAQPIQVNRRRLISVARSKKAPIKPLASSVSPLGPSPKLVWT